MIEQQQQQRRLEWWWRRHRGRRRPLGYSLNWLFLAMLVSNCKSSPAPLENKTESSTEKSESGMGLISPRMDYEEWTPLGRGDPLKNNPTFDYVPPVLDKVQYWLDSQTTEAAPKRDILVLGVTAKKTSPKIPQRFFNLVDGNDGQLILPAKQHSKLKGQPLHLLQQRADFTGSSGAELPHIRRASNFQQKFASPQEEYSKEPGKTASYYSSPYYTGPQQGNKLHATRLLSDHHQSIQQTVNQENSHQSSYFPAFPSHVRLEKNTSSSSQKVYGGGSLKATGFSRDRGERPVNSAGNIAVTPNFQAPKPPASSSNRVKVEKSNLIYESTHTLSSDWLEPHSTLVQKPTDSRIRPVQLLLPLSYNKNNNYNHYPHQHHHYQDDGDHDVAPSVNHPIIIPHNATIGKTVPDTVHHSDYPPKITNESNVATKMVANYSLSNKLFPAAVDAHRDSDDTEDRNSQHSSMNVYQDPTIKHDTVSKESIDQHVTESDQEPVTQLLQSAASEKNMHIVIANSHSGQLNGADEQVESGGGRTSTPLAIVMPTNYTNDTLPTVLENLHLTTTTTALPPSETTTDWSQSDDQLDKLTANDLAHVSNSASSSDSMPDTPKRVLIAPPPPPPPSVPLVQSVAKETQMSPMPQYPGSNHQPVLVPPNMKASPYHFTQQSQLTPHSYPQRYMSLPSRLAPNSHPQPQSHSPHMYMLQQRPQLMMESVKDRRPFPGATGFSKGVPHSAFNPQSAASSMSSSVHMPVKQGQPLTSVLMSMPVEMRVSMSMPSHGTAHLSPPPPTGHMAPSSIPLRTILTQDQAPSKQASFDHATHTRVPGLALSATGALSSEMPSATNDQTILNLSGVKPAASHPTPYYTAVDTGTRSKITSARPILTDNTGSIDEVGIANGSIMASYNNQLYRPSKEDLTKKGPLVSLLTEDRDNVGKGPRYRQEVCTPDTNEKEIQSSMTTLPVTTTQGVTIGQDEIMPGQVHPKTTTVASLTTDPIFSHYKQPAKPIRGPMYLIIQGHSKVKTYKPNLNKHTGLHGDQGQERQDNAKDMAEKQLSKFDQYVRIRENAIKDGKGAANSTADDKGISQGKPRQADQYMEQHAGTLMGLVESGLGQIVSESPVVSTRTVRSSIATIPSSNPKSNLNAGVKEMSAKNIV